MTYKLIFYFTILMFIVNACEQKPVSDEATKVSNNLVMATLYQYYAAEYKALAHQAYNIGMDRLHEIRKERPDANNLAVVVDIDETVLDNSPYEAKLILNDQGYTPDTWHAWCDLSSANAVPGALEFLQLADSLGFQIYYLSNRKKQFTQESTMTNLQKLGFPQLTDDHFLLRVNESSKVARRNKILENHEIVLLAGDNLGDFYADSPDPDTRANLMKNNKGAFGERYIVLPNAMYGEWVTALQMNKSTDQVHYLLEKMAQAYD